MHPDQSSRFISHNLRHHSNQRQAPRSMRANLNKLNELYGELELLLQQALQKGSAKSV